MKAEELSNEIYNGVIIEADNFDAELSSQFEVLAEESSNESEYLQKAKKLIEEINSYDDEELTDLFYGETPNRRGLEITLKQISNNILELESKLKAI